MEKLNLRQIEFLMEVHENEILHLPPLTVRNSLQTNCLLKYGLIDIFTQIKDSRVFWKYRITIKGKEYLLGSVK